MTALSIKISPFLVSHVVSESTVTIIFISSTTKFTENKGGMNKATTEENAWCRSAIDERLHADIIHDLIITIIITIIIIIT